MPWVGAQRDLLRFPPFPPSLLLCLLPGLSLYPPGFGFHPVATPFGQAWDTMCPLGLRLLHLGKITVDLSIPQNEAPTRQIHLSLANTHYPKGLIFMHDYAKRLSSCKGRGWEGTKQMNSTDPHVYSLYLLRCRWRVSEISHVSAFALFLAFPVNLLFSW